MNKYFPKLINIFIFTILIIQILIYLFNSNPSTDIITKRNTSVENFSSIILSNSGITKIGSNKLNKIDDEIIYLEGDSYLENKDYKIYGTNIYINTKKEASESKDSVVVINSMGKLKADGFKNLDSVGKIFFKGKVIFHIHD